MKKNSAAYAPTTYSVSRLTDQAEQNCTVPATGHIKLDNPQRKVSQHQGLIHPFRQVVASFQSRSHLSGVHRGVLRQCLLVLPLEELDAIFRIWLATEVAIGCGLLVLWLAQGQGRSNGTRSAIELNLQNVRDVVRAQLAALRVVALHDTLCHLSANVRSRAVHLSRVLARECTATVRAPASVRVDDNLTASQASIALRTTDDKLSRWVDVVMRVGAVQSQRCLAALQLDLRQRSLDHVLFDQLVHFLHRRGSHLWASVACALLGAHCLQGFCVLSGEPPC